MRHPWSAKSAAYSLSFLKKNIVELRHALAPDGFEVVEELASALEPRVVGGHQLLAAVCTFLNEPRALEHGAK